MAKETSKPAVALNSPDTGTGPASVMTMPPVKSGEDEDTQRSAPASPDAPTAHAREQRGDSGQAGGQEQQGAGDDPHRCCESRAGRQRRDLGSLAEPQRTGVPARSPHRAKAGEHETESGNEHDADGSETERRMNRNERGGDDRRDQTPEQPWRTSREPAHLVPGHPSPADVSGRGERARGSGSAEVQRRDVQGQPGIRAGGRARDPGAGPRMAQPLATIATATRSVCHPPPCCASAAERTAKTTVDVQAAIHSGEPPASTHSSTPERSPITTPMTTSRARPGDRRSPRSNGVERIHDAVAAVVERAATPGGRRLSTRHCTCQHRRSSPDRPGRSGSSWLQTSDSRGQSGHRVRRSHIVDSDIHANPDTGAQWAFAATITRSGDGDGERRQHCRSDAARGAWHQVFLPAALAQSGRDLACDEARRVPDMGQR